MGVIEDIRALLRSDDERKPWLAYLEAIGDPDFDVVLPSADDLPPMLVKLAVPHEDINDLVAMLPTRQRSAGLWWLLGRCTHALVRTMGMVDGPPQFPALPASMGALHRYFYVYVFLAALPHVRAFHRRQEIPDDVSWLTLADLGRNMAVHRRLYGTGGLDVADWLMLHFRGAIYALGRLQFERTTLDDRVIQALDEAGLPYGPGTPALSVHIPDFYGPLSPHACDKSFARAREFFARHFAEESYEVGVCYSWLLDDQLTEYLPEGSNIIRFQRRFHPAYRPEDDDEDIMRFVFGRIGSSLDDLPQRTVLERAIVDHRNAGRHWRGGAGWLRL